MIKTAIVLAGGFGTRLQTVVKDVPKPMALVNGKPFLQYALGYLQHQRMERCLLAVGYKWEMIEKFFGSRFESMTLEYVVEKEPLGTGGAIAAAARMGGEEEYFVVNGDTLFTIDLEKFYARHESANAELSLALKPMHNFDRYGVVRTNAGERITSFEEKKFYREGNINGGIYVLVASLLDEIAMPEKFSFEKDLLEPFCSSRRFFGFPCNDYFIDIGIPEDYERAQSELDAFAY